MPSRCGQWYLLNDCQNQIKLIFLHQVDFIDLVDFASNQSIFWHRVGCFDQVDFADERGTNRVDYYYNGANSEQNRVVFF